MRIQIVGAEWSYTDGLKNKELHLVGFAELGMAFFRDFIVSTCGFSLEQAISHCESINKADETGTLYPSGYLTGLPVRFFRQEMSEQDRSRFLECLMDAFIANREYCKSNEMVFHYACAISNRNLIIDETIRMAQGISNDPNLHTITIVADEPFPLTEVQRLAVLR